MESAFVIGVFGMLAGAAIAASGFLVLLVPRMRAWWRARRRPDLPELHFDRLDRGLYAVVRISFHRLRFTGRLAHWLLGDATCPVCGMRRATRLEGFVDCHVCRRRALEISMGRAISGTRRRLRRWSSPRCPGADQSGTYGRVERMMAKRKPELVVSDGPESVPSVNCCLGRAGERSECQLADRRRPVH